MKILTAYTLKMFLPTLAISLFLFSFILIMERLFQMVEIVLTKGVGAGEIFILILYSLPTILVLTVPMSAAAASVITFGKMASDREITAIRTSGNSIYPIIRPAVGAALIIALIMIPFNYHIAPASNYAFRYRFTHLAYREPAIQIEEGTQVEIGEYTLMAHSVNHRRQTLTEVMINKPADSQEPEMFISARRGIWKTEKDSSLVLMLYDGVIRHQPTGRPEILSSVEFQEYSITIHRTEEDISVSKNLESKSYAEMKEEISRLKERGLPTKTVTAHLHIRGALAGAALALVLCGIPLGLRAEVKGKTIGIGLSVAVIAIYYFLMTGGIKLAFNGDIAPWLGVWIPNFIMGGLGAVMIAVSFNR